MKRPDYSVLLKILATAAVVLVIYAAAATVRTAVFGTDGGLASVAYFVITMLLGYMAGVVLLGRIPKFAIKASVLKPVKFLSFMLNLGDAAYSASAFVAWIIALLPVLAAFFIFIRHGIYRTAFEMIAAIIIYSVALRYSQSNFSQILNNRNVYAGFITLALCLELLYILENLAYLKPWLLAISYFFILIYLLIKNQEDIDNNIFDKKHIEKSILPRNLRRLNTFWVCVLFLAIVLLFNLKPLAIFLLQLLIKISIYLAAAFMWLSGHLLQSSDGAQQLGSGGGLGFFGAGIEIIQPFKNLITNAFRNAVALYIFYRLLLLLIRWVPGLALRVFNLIKKLFAFKKGENTLETTDYSDESEMVRPIHKIEQSRHLNKRIRKSRRTLKSISDPAEKVRYMYASIMEMLPMLGIRAEQSDTTADILKKTAAAVDISSELSPFTGIYNQVRYGDKIPDGEVLVKAEGHFDKTVEVIGQK